MEWPTKWRAADFFHPYNTPQKRKPADLTFIQAASITLAGITAYSALVRSGKVNQGTRVLINGGTGGVGLAAIQIARNLGAYVVVIASKPSFHLVKSLGADEVVDYRDAAFFENLERDYSADGKRFDVIFDVSPRQEKRFFDHNYQYFFGDADGTLPVPASPRRKHWLTIVCRCRCTWMSEIWNQDGWRARA